MSVSMSDDVCGSTDTASGDPCQKPAGWGTDEETGNCKQHRGEYNVPDKLNEERIQEICGAAEEGAYKKHCAMAAGITADTLRNWLAQGKQHKSDGIESPQADLFSRYHRARGKGALEKLQEAGPQFILERSYGYTKKERIEMTGADGGPIKTDEVSDEDAKELQDYTEAFRGRFTSDN